MTRAALRPVASVFPQDAPLAAAAAAPENFRRVNLVTGVVEEVAEQRSQTNEKLDYVLDRRLLGIDPNQPERVPLQHLAIRKENISELIDRLERVCILNIHVFFELLEYDDYISASARGRVIRLILMSFLIKTEILSFDAIDKELVDQIIEEKSLEFNSRSKSLREVILEVRKNLNI